VSGRHTFVTTVLDAGVDLRDVQIAARQADPRTTMRYARERARMNPAATRTAFLAAYMAPDQPGVSPRSAASRHPRQPGVGGCRQQAGPRRCSAPM
jgi:hypothetical protein